MGDYSRVEEIGDSELRSWLYTVAIVTNLKREGRDLDLKMV